MLLENRNAVIYGGGGAIGGAVARAFAREGARVFIVGRTQAKLDAVADDIRAAGGGSVETAIVDALDEQSVDAHAEAVVSEAGSLDISMNVITHPYTHGTRIDEMSADDYMAPVEAAMRSTFITARAAAREMVKQDRGGVILAFGGSGEPARDYYLGGTQVAFDAIESFRRQFSAELGPHGVRFITLATGGVPDESLAGSHPEIVDGIREHTMVGRAATHDDVGNAAVFAASDWARMLTAATINISGGALVDR